MASTTVESVLGEDEWYSLVSTVVDGSCTLMLGPDAVTGYLGDERLPIHVALATYMKRRLPQEIRDRLGSRYDFLDPSRPASVAQMVLREIDRAQIKRWLEDFRQEFRPEHSPLGDLAQLPFEVVINTSPATAVYDVFHAANADAGTTFYDRTGRKPGLMPEPSQGRPVVYQLYGSLENPRSLILSDTDRLDFIVGLARDNPPLPVNLTSILHDDNRSFLFLGFDLADWHFRVLLHILSQASNRNYTSFASELEASPLEPADRDFYRVSHKIHFFAGDLGDFAAELRRRVDAESTPGNGGQGVSQPLAASAPTVFICHASEDAEHARRIADGLRASGIATWVDKENLRGGAQWSKEIERTIRNVNYVVVVQSSAMKGKDVGYVNREIDMALDRQREYRFPRVFVIPTVVEGDENRLDLAEFEQLQSVDVSPAAGVSDLVRAIFRDLDLAERGTR
jgi:hypothetical protein